MGPDGRESGIAWTQGARRDARCVPGIVVGWNSDRVDTSHDPSAHSSPHIVYIQDTDGDENWHVHRVTVTGGGPIEERTVDLTPFRRTVDNGPVRYYRYDRGDSPNTTFLLSNRPALDDAPLTRMNPVVITARDGLDMVGFYSLPS